MIRETFVYEKTVEAALQKGADELGIPVKAAKYDVLEEPKRGFLGIGASDAKVRVYYEESPADIACDFVKTLLKNMEVEAEVSVSTDDEGTVTVSVSGEGLGLLIGRHGDVLDSVQHLAGLAANKGREDFTRITVDVENYRAKREETLRQLARRTAQRALKYRRNQTLEPMNAYERRIIHTEVQDIDGVITYSVGSDADRRIVIAPEKKKNFRDKNYSAKNRAEKEFKSENENEEFED